jgi:hypothetical protein
VSDSEIFKALLLVVDYSKMVYFIVYFIREICSIGVLPHEDLVLA